MTDNNFFLVNPRTVGDKHFSSSNTDPNAAAKDIYSALSKYFTNKVDTFFMSVYDTKNKKLRHFIVKEDTLDNGNIGYNVNALDGSFKPEVEEKLVSISEHTGGRHHSSSSSDSSDSSDSESTTYMLSKYTQPISKFIYYYLPYYKLLDVTIERPYNIFVPTFNFPVNPTVEFKFDIFRTFYIRRQ